MLEIGSFMKCIFFPLNQLSGFVVAAYLVGHRMRATRVYSLNRRQSAREWWHDVIAASHSP